MEGRGPKSCDRNNPKQKNSTKVKIKSFCGAPQFANGGGRQLGAGRQATGEGEATHPEQLKYAPSPLSARAQYGLQTCLTCWCVGRMAGLLWHSVDPITAALSVDGVLGLLGLALPAEAAVGMGPRLVRLGGEGGDGGVARDTGSPRAAAGRTCWKADLTTSITSSASELSLCWLLLSPLRCDDGDRRRFRRGGGEDEVGDDVRSGVTTRPRGDGCAGSEVVENAECGDLCSGEASRSAGLGARGPCGGSPG